MEDHRDNRIQLPTISSPLIPPGYKQTEVGVIPEDWSVAALGNLSDFITSGSRGWARYYSDQGALFIRSQNVRGGRLDLADSQFVNPPSGAEGNRTRVERYDLLITITGNSVGNVALVEQDLDEAYISQHVGLVRLREPSSGQYLCRFLSPGSPGNGQIWASQSGQSKPGLTLGNLHDFWVALPPPSEQSAITDALSDVDALLSGLDRLIAKKRGLKQAAMQQLLTGQTRLAGFPGESDSVDFGDIAIIRNVKVISSSAPAGTQCVELDSVGQGTGQLLGSIDASGSSSKYSFKKGDVLFGRLRAYLRKYWLASFDGICSTEIWPLIPRDERLCAGYLHLLVQTNGFVDAAGVSYGTHMPRSDWSVLSKFTVSLPSVAEQTAIATFLSDMDAELAALESRRNKTRALKQAMMQELLTGRTRLVQPEDVAHAQVRV